MENILNTGSSNQFNKYNIYDLAGNLIELTIESNISGVHGGVGRGGSWGPIGTNSPVNYRWGTPIGEQDFMGFRATVY